MIRRNGLSAKVVTSRVNRAGETHTGEAAVADTMTSVKRTLSATRTDATDTSARANAIEIGNETVIVTGTAIGTDTGIQRETETATAARRRTATASLAKSAKAPHATRLPHPLLEWPLLKTAGFLHVLRRAAESRCMERKLLASGDDRQKTT